MNADPHGTDPGRFLDLLERLRETFGLYEQAAALAERQVRDAMAAADRIRREAENEVTATGQGTADATRLRAELDAVRIERDALRRERDRLIADGATQERRFRDEIAQLRAQVVEMAEAIEDLVQQLERTTQASAPLRVR